MSTEPGCTDMSEASQATAMDGGRQASGKRRGGAVAWGRAAAIAGVTIGLSLASFGALADGPEGAGYAHHGMWGGGWGGMFFGLIMMLLVIAAIVAVVVLVVRVLGGAGSGTARPSGKTPTDILEERFARGEIDAEEFEERRRVLAKEAT